MEYFLFFCGFVVGNRVVYFVFERLYGKGVKDGIFCCDCCLFCGNDWFYSIDDVYISIVEEYVMNVK